LIEALLGWRKLCEAISKFKLATQIDPRNIRAWRSWGEALIDMECYKAGICKFRKAVEIDPYDGDGYAGWGKALAALDRSRGRCPIRPLRHESDLLADLIIRPGMIRDEAQHAYDLDPWHPLIHLALAGFEEGPIRADFLRRYSLDRLPNDPRLCQRAAEFLRKQEKEDLAREVEVRGKV
jgi:tetratricopeptide (TPR) repeat protein